MKSGQCTCSLFFFLNYGGNINWLISSICKMLLTSLWYLSGYHVVPQFRINSTLANFSWTLSSSLTVICSFANLHVCNFLPLVTEEKNWSSKDIFNLVIMAQYPAVMCLVEIICPNK